VHEFKHQPGVGKHSVATAALLIPLKAFFKGFVEQASNQVLAPVKTDSAWRFVSARAGVTFNCDFAKRHTL
jgi:hypothetical protein